MRISFAQLAFLEINQKHLYFFMADGCVRQLPGSMSEFEVLKLGGMQKVFSISKLTGRVMIDGELKD